MQIKKVIHFSYANDLSIDVLYSCLCLSIKLMRHVKLVKIVSYVYFVGLKAFEKCCSYMKNEA